MGSPKAGDQIKRESEIRSPPRIAGDSLDVYRTVVEDQNDLIMRWRPDGTVTWVNHAYCQMVGMEEEECVGRNFLDGIPPEGVRHIRDEMNRLTPGHPSWRSTSPIPKKGETHWVEWSNRGVFDEEESLVSLQSVGRDVTQRKADEEALKEREAWFRVLIENAPEAIVILDGETGAFLTFNDRAVALFGRTREELAGASPAELSPPTQPDGRTSREAARERLGRALAGESLVFEWTHTRGDGSEVLCEVRLTRLPVPGSRIVRGSLLDLSDWKEAQKQLRLTQAAVDQVADGALVIRPDAKIIYANQALGRFLGTRRESLLGQSVQDLYEGFPRRGWRRFWRSVRDEGSRTLLLDHPAKGKRKSTFEVHLSIIAFDGHEFGVCTVRDRTERMETERSLAFRKSLLEAQVEASRDGILVVDPGGEMILHNRRLQEILDPDGGSLEPDPEGRLNWVLNRMAIPEAFRKGMYLLQEDPDRRTDEDVPLKDGRVLECHGAPLRGDGDQVFGYLWVFRDVTAQRRAEETLKENRERLEIFTGAGFEGIAVSEEGRLLDLNPQMAEMLGADREEMLAKTVIDWVAPQSRDRVKDRILSHSDDPYEFLARRKDGSTFPAEARGRAMSYGGRTVRVTAIRDLTRRKVAEAALSQSEADFRGLVENAPYGIFRTSTHGEILSANPALVQMLGYPSAEALVGADLPETICHDLKAVRGLLRTMREGKPVEGAELGWQTLDGRKITVWLSGRPVADGDGTVQCFEMIAEDVTERRKLQAQLRQAQKMEAVGQLTGGIAHDFNNLLSVILLHTELLRDALAETDPVLRSAVQGVGEAAERAAAMTTQLLGFSRQANLSFVPTDLTRVTRSLSALVRRLLPETIHIEIVAPDTMPPVSADSGAVEQMLLNLCTNARDAMPDGGTLEIRVSDRVVNEDYSSEHPWAPAGDYVCVTVTDTGMGMDEKTRTRIFEPFFTTKPSGVGTGLGMAMVYGLTKQHEGFVDIRTKVGDGTSITLCFPKLPSAQARMGSGAGDAEMPGGTETVLLVEDEDMLRAVGKGVLKQHGYTVLVAANGEEALEVFSDHAEEIDLIVSDLVMPRIGGFELLEAIRRDRQPTRVLLTSGYPGNEAGNAKRVDPTVPFLQKPWKAGDLLRKVRETLDGP